MHHPCAENPDLWFGYNDGDGIDGTAITVDGTAHWVLDAQGADLLVVPAELACARLAVEQGEEYGVWAGVKLPGGQYRKRGELRRSHETLRQIADGELSPREIPGNAALLERHGGEVLPVVAAVFHLPGAQVGPPTAA